MFTYLVCSTQLEDTVNISPKGTLDISLSNIRNSKGYIYIFIYSYENQYPYEPYKHYKVKKENVNQGVLTARISNLQLKDEYAISLIDDEKSPSELIKEGVDPELVKDISNRIRINEYKRRQAAPGLRVTSKAFGMGRRVPIINQYDELKHD